MLAKKLLYLGSKTTILYTLLLIRWGIMSHTHFPTGSLPCSVNWQTPQGDWKLREEQASHVCLLFLSRPKHNSPLPTNIGSTFQFYLYPHSQHQCHHAPLEETKPDANGPPFRGASPTSMRGPPLCAWGLSSSPKAPLHRDLHLGSMWAAIWLLRY